MKKIMIILFTITLLLLPSSALADEAVYPNPDLQAGCGLDIVMVLDESGSINSTEAQQMRDAATAVYDSMEDTGSRLAIVEFNTSAPSASS